ncbi:microsomal dipeptidase [Microdochium trichocladiopsis]|uniref:Dipeptidase n=1 Tax=Microdochium trichocladiopsis TaxID=1682393 RepID=A0A9P8XZZ5_9PEZI|nr:microsomal dipeptidase [Microdochium trichocladiopsis]KAH7025155.1 microsomal dipeptidase [Microdochium trichocladiopsis]
MTSRLQEHQPAKWLFWLAASCVAGIAGYLYIGQGGLQGLSDADYAGRTQQLLRTTPLIDGHNDLPYLLRIELQNKIYNSSYDFRNQLSTGHTDLERLRQGKVGGQFWSVFVECPDLENLDDPSHSVRDTLEQVDVTRRFIEQVEELQFCDTPACVSSAFRSGRVASMLGAEGLHQAGSSIAVIRQLFDLGVRYITITHNCDNPFATAASTVTAGGADEALSEFGIAGIREMNRLGMMVDLSHASHETMRQVLDVTQAPIIFSHSTCYELAKTYRNAPDDVLARLRQNGGVLMIMFVKRFLNAEDPEAADIERVVDHIMHVVEVAGWDHVGIGGDFDGTVTLANGITSVADYPKLIEAVMKRGATDSQVKKLVGQNLLRVWAENERVAARLSREIMPVEDVWKGRLFTRWNNPLPRLIPDNPNRIAATDYP